MAAGNEQPAPAETLPQSEVESLLPQAQQGSVVVLPQEHERAGQSARQAQPYDFRHPAFLTAGELRKLRLRCEEFIRSLGARLSIHLRLEFSLKLARLHTLTYQKFTSALPDPAQLSLFKIEPLRGVGILDVHPRLGLTIVDRLLGGPATAVKADRELSEIEVALFAQAAQLILAEWCHHWAAVQELRPTLLGHESSGRFLNTASHDTVLLVLTMEAKMGDCAEPMQIALPCTTIEPLVRKFSQNTAEPPRPAAIPKWNRNFDEVTVPVAAVWSDLQLTAREIVNLKPGDVLPLPAACARRVKLRLGSVAKFEGQLGTTGGKWAVSVTQPIKTGT